MIEANVSRRKNEYGEWVVRVWEDGIRNPAADYFTTDKQDAEDTARAMVTGERASDPRPLPPYRPIL